MRCPSLSELPPPPAGRHGWPWTVASATLPPAMDDGSAWPLITVVTPSFNQARYLEATIRSILLQGYPNIEYFVLDGGSSDHSTEIIHKYARWIAHWMSEPDGGQSAAINRGLGLGSGVLATWINSDDMLAENAFVRHARQGGFQANVVYVGDCLYIDERGQSLNMHRGRVRTLEDLLRVRTVWRGRPARGHIVQPEVLFPRQLALDVGGANVRNHRTMDYELWGKLMLAGASFVYTHVPFAMFRLHAEQKTSQSWATTRSLIASALQLVAQADRLPVETQREIADDLRAYQRDYWLETGLLARLGLPEALVLPLRDFSYRLRHRAASVIRGTS